MADITQKDVMLLFTMGLAVVSMSFVFPALGIGGENVDANEIPEFDINDSRFDFAGEFPRAPGSPNTGDLVWIDSRDTQLNRIWLDGDTSDGVEVLLLPPLDANDTMDIRINEWDSGNVVYEETLTFNATGTTHIYRNESLGYEMTFESVTLDRDAGEYRVEYEVISQVTSDGWISGVPVLGATLQGAEATAATLGWFVEIFVWAVSYIFEFLANTASIMGDVAGYLIGLISWLTSTYTSIVSSAGSWVSVFVALPGILLSAVLAKFVIIAVGLLPTT